MRVFRTKAVSRFLKRERISDGRLLEAVATLDRGLIDADLGHGLVKQRVARLGKAKAVVIVCSSHFDRSIAQSFCSASPRTNGTILTTISWRRLGKSLQCGSRHPIRKSREPSTTEF